jgi:hypothetical protein
LALRGRRIGYDGSEWPHPGGLNWPHRVRGISMGIFVSA